VFDWYTESARRAIYAAVLAAQQGAGKRIEIAHLLRGLVSVEAAFQNSGLTEAISLQPGERASRDLPLSHPLKRVLAYAAEESQKLGQTEINCLHLALGILREDPAQAWPDRGFTRDIILKMLPPGRPLPPPFRLLAHQHLILFLIGLVLFLGIQAFQAMELLQPIPYAEIGDRAMRLHAVLAIPSAMVWLFWGLAVLLCLAGSGFRSGRFSRRSRWAIPLACVLLLFLSRRNGFLLVIRTLHWQMFPASREL
jgi:hypothetical protein